jgi:hypothetical protein
MTRFFGTIAVSILFLLTNSKVPGDPVTFVPISDSIGFEVRASYDSQGLLNLYGARVYTPVCEGGKCYAVEIDLYWDLSGRFFRYDTIPGKRLTKLDHIPFSDSDYLKLKQILNNSNSPLAAFTKEQLVKNTRSSSIDGITGATIGEVKDAVIEGAVYSCHTLWHIANGPVSDSLQKHTINSLNRVLVRKLVDQNDSHTNYFLIHNFSAYDFAIYLPEVLEAIKKGEGYFAKNAIEKLPAELLCEIESQDFFTAHYQNLDYFAQVALLEKLEARCVNEDLKKVLLLDTDQRNSYKNELIKKLEH